MIPGSAFTIPVRPRRFLDLPGDNSVRGLSNVPMKGEYQFKLQVTLRTKEAMLKGMPHQASTGSTEDLGRVISLTDVEEEIQEAPDAEALTVEESDVVPLFPLGAVGEVVPRIHSDVRRQATGRSRRVRINHR